MIDFKKRLQSIKTEKKINPLEIYETLDRSSETGPLRPVQQKVLQNWFENKVKEKDIIIKLHTGQGKTLIGLLILQSKLNIQDNQPALYICPNKYLVSQTKEEAEKFGIKVCIINDGDYELPSDFINKRAILITHVQKLFNGKTKFGIGAKFIQVGTIILDDSHACIDAIKDAMTIKIGADHSVYKSLLTLLADEIRMQGEGSYLEIIAGEQETILPVPYWAWKEKAPLILEILAENKEDDRIKFLWPLIKDNINNCNALFTGTELEISLYHVPIEQFGSYYNASHRILMSATTMDDSFFVKGLGININAIENPLFDERERWSGEKMILIPSLIDDALDRNTVVNFFAKPMNKSFGIVALVPSFKKAQQYEVLASTVAKANSITDEIKKLKNKVYEQTLVIVNRYDGIDLPDNTCRILIMDSRPVTQSLADRYEESTRTGSEIIAVKIAQKIEQGLGRSVRGEKDYSVILIIGNDLISFMKSDLTKRYFSSQTQKQLDIGLEIVQFALEEQNESGNVFDVIIKIINQSVRRDEGWKAYYEEQMESLQATQGNKKVYQILDLEWKAEDYFIKGDPEKASETIQKLIDKYITSNSEKGWYLQQKARYVLSYSKIESTELQLAAFKNNSQLLRPKEGVTYKRLSFINEDRIKRIQIYISAFTDFNQLMLHLDELLSNLSFGEPSEKFEDALQKLGLLLGFLSERPDKELKIGPDNLWCGVDNQYFIFECKNQVSEDRQEVTKTEISQMNTACAWFDKEYRALQVKRIMISPTRNASKSGTFATSVYVMRKSTLNNLKSNIKSFLKEFKNFNIHEISEAKIQTFINAHNLDIESLKTKYVEDFYFK